jgi:hypothetical protein
VKKDNAQKSVYFKPEVTVFFFHQKFHHPTLLCGTNTGADRAIGLQGVVSVSG